MQHDNFMVDLKKKVTDFKKYLREFLLSSKDTITLDEARKRHNKKWTKTPTTKE